MATSVPTWKNLHNLDRKIDMNYRMLPKSSGGTGEYKLSTSPKTYRDNASAYAQWQRSKPLILTPTPLEIREIVDNTASYERIFSGPTNRVKGDAMYVYGNTSPTGTFQSSTVSSSDGMAELNRALAKSTDFNFGLSIAESKDTISFISKNIRRITSFGMALRRGDIRQAQDVLSFDLSRSAKGRVENMTPADRLASGYLEFSFGLMPLLNDVSSVAKAYENGLATRGLKISARAGLRPSMRRASFDNAWSRGPTASASFTGTVVNPRLRDLNSLGLLNVPQILYNKYPLSFVLDWFIPIGTYLGGATAGAGLGRTSACVVTSTQSRSWILYQGTQYPVSITQNIYRAVTSPTPSLLGLAPASIRSFGQIVTLAALAHTRLGTSSRYK